MTDVRKALRKAPEHGCGEAECRAEMKGKCGEAECRAEMKGERIEAKCRMRAEGKEQII